MSPGWMSTYRRRLAHGEGVEGVGFRDGLSLMIVLFAGIIPLASTVGIPVFACFTTAILLFLRSIRRRRATPPFLRYALLLVSLSSVWLVHGSFVGMEPGVTLFVSLFAIKVIELRNRREYQTVASLGFFLLLCNLFISSDLSSSLWQGVVFISLCAVLQRFHADAGEEGTIPMRLVLRRVGAMLMMATPVILILFFFFPRLPQGFGMQLFHKQTTGMSDELSPGSVEEVVADGSLAFRVRFLNHDPKMAPFYWRGVVLWQSQGLEWTRGSYALEHPRFLRRRGSDQQFIHQEVILEPHGGRWLLALDQPVYGPEHSRLEAGRYLLSRSPVDQRRLYEAFSVVDLDEQLSAMEREVALKVPAREKLPPRLLELVGQWKGDDRAKMIEAQRFFSTKGFTYTLESGSYDNRNGWRMLDEFLFERKRGFCSHYAAAFSSLMRLAGVPARAIIGYAGGDFNPAGGFYSIYQSDAHAWSEVWLEGEGWVRIDPTRYVPGGAEPRNRVEAATSEESEAEAFTNGQAGFTQQFPALRRLGYQWAALNYRWTLWVLGYDRDVQRQFFNSLGLRHFHTVAIFGAALLVAGLVMAALWWWLMRWRQREEPLLRAYRQLCKRLAEVTPERRPGETPSAYRERVLALRPDLRPALDPLFAQYQLLRYAPWKLEDPKAALSTFREAVAALRP